MEQMVINVVFWITVYVQLFELKRTNLGLGNSELFNPSICLAVLLQVMVQEIETTCAVKTVSLEAHENRKATKFIPEKFIKTKEAFPILHITLHLLFKLGSKMNSNATMLWDNYIAQITKAFLDQDAKSVLTCPECNNQMKICTLCFFIMLALVIWVYASQVV